MVSFFKWNFQHKFFFTFDRKNIFQLMTSSLFFVVVVSFSITETENSWQNPVHLWSKPEKFPDVLFNQFTPPSVSFKSAFFLPRKKGMISVKISIYWKPSFPMKKVLSETSESLQDWPLPFEAASHQISPLLQREHQVSGCTLHR